MNHYDYEIAILLDMRQQIELMGPDLKPEEVVAMSYLSRAIEALEEANMVLPSQPWSRHETNEN